MQSLDSPPLPACYYFVELKPGSVSGGLATDGGMSIPFDRRVSVPSRVLLQQVGEESVLLDLRSECYFGLDPVGTRMWAALTEASTIEAAFAELRGMYEVEPERLRGDLEKLVEKLVEQGLLEVAPAAVR